MQHLQGRNREETFSTSLGASIQADNPVRVIDAFVDALPLLEMGFKGVTPKATGRPSFDPYHLLKLYLYGYYNKIRSSRKLEQECKRNLELQWLLQGLTPAYHTIADFRKDNPLSLREVFKSFVAFLKDAQLLKGKYIAIDGTKIRAQNSRKNNYNQKKITRQLDYIQKKTEEYLAGLEKEDQKDSTDAKASRAEIEKALENLKLRQLKYELLEKEVEQSNDGQISTTDKESRALIQHHNVVEVSYNSQAAVESKHSLITHYQATNKNDAKALAAVALAAKKAVGKKRITVLADKGYHNGEQLGQCLKQGIITIVACREPSREAVPSAPYYLEKFSYNAKTDHYSCPKGELLTSNGSWYEANKPTEKRKNATPNLVKHYKSKACLACSVKALCTKNPAGRLIVRSEHQHAIDANNQRLHKQKEVYRKRQAIVEHPFGTIKRSWGYTYTLLKGLKKVDGELGLIFTCYNLRRSVSILSVEKLLKLMKNYNKWPTAALYSLPVIYQKPSKQILVLPPEYRQLYLLG